jgi:hypothetical protein
LERDFVELLDFNTAVSGIIAQPIRLRYSVDESEPTTYTPDYLVRFRPIGNRRAASPALCEVKYEEELQDRRDELAPKFAAARKLCRERNWRFRTITERYVRVAYLKNVKLLRSFRDEADPEALGHMLMLELERLKDSTPKELLAATFMGPDRRVMAMRSLWRLVANRVIGCDLSQPLTMDSEIWHRELTSE